MILSIDAVGASTGGNITILNNILYYLSKIDPDLQVTVYIEETPWRNYYIYTNNKIKIKAVSDKSLPQKIMWQQFDLHTRMKKEGGDLILSITNIGSFFPKVPQIVYFHQALLFIPNKQLFSFFNFSYIIRFIVLKLFVVLGFIKAKAIIAQTDFVKQNIIRQLPSVKDKVYRVYSGIPKIFEQQQSNWKEPEGMDGVLKILYIAHPAEYKNFDILFETAKLAKKDGVRFKFLLTLDRQSDNPRYQNFIDQYMQKVTDYNIEEYICFIGSLKNNAEIKQVYQFSDIVIHPSFVESFPQTFTEAMQYGKPLISADLPYAREIAGDASLYFGANDPVSLLNCLESYKKDAGLLSEMSLKSKERVEFFDPIRRWAELYMIIKKSKGNS
jgi:glycosyltransferase involved in cell wall biosynthesis